MPLTTGELAEICGGEIEGDAERVIVSANTIESATAADISFAANTKAIEAAARSKAGCLLVPLSFNARGTWSLIRVADPRVSFARALAALYPKHRPPALIHHTAIVAPSAEIAADCFIGAYSTIGAGTRIESGCYVGEGCRIGERVIVRRQTTMYPNVVLYDGVQVGQRVILHAGCVIGSDGFGFALVNNRYEKFPQVGIVEIEDDVEIGANSCIDRAALGVTRIGAGAKLDNLVHVGHNCVIGKHVVIAAQTGFSGGATVGDSAVIGGQVGVGERARIDSKAIVGGQSGILSGRPVTAAEPVWGTPARPLRQHLKGLANVAKIPELREELKALERKLAALELKIID